MGQPVARQRTTRTQRAEQSRRAYELRLSGATYDDIAAELGISHATVGARLTEAAAARTDPLVDQYREIENDRLDRLLRALRPGIEAGDTSAVGAAVRISERRAKLLGLDSPERVDLALSRATDTAGDLLADALSAALSAVLDVSRPDPRWRSELERYGEQMAAWVLTGREGERPVAPVPPPEPEPAGPGVIEPTTVMPGPDHERELTDAIRAFEVEFGSLSDS